MNFKEELIKNIYQIHTTKLGLIRIKKNINIDNLEYLKELILNSKVIKKGKNYYAQKDSIIITINSYSYTIITAHKGEK